MNENKNTNLEDSEPTIKEMFFEMIFMIRENWSSFYHGDQFDICLYSSKNLRIQKMLWWTNFFRSLFLPIIFICLVLSTIFNILSFLTGFLFLIFSGAFTYLNTSGFLSINQFNILENEIKSELDKCGEQEQIKG